MSDRITHLLQRERNALDRERLATERQRSAEQELAGLRARRTLNWSVFGPVLVAVIGATASVMATAVSQYYQSRNVRIAAEEQQEAQRLANEAEVAVQREAAQQDLIRLSVTAEPSRADANLRFLVAAGLVDTYAEGIAQALAKGERLSIPQSEQEVCGAPGCFVPPRLISPESRLSERILGNYAGDDGESHASVNALQFCVEKGYEGVRDFDVSCEGRDESFYLGYLEQTDAWLLIGTGSANGYCYPLLEWVRCD